MATPSLISSSLSAERSLRRVKMEVLEACFVGSRCCCFDDADAEVIASGRAYM